MQRTGLAAAAFGALLASVGLAATADAGHRRHAHPDAAEFLGYPVPKDCSRYRIKWYRTDRHYWKQRYLACLAH